jgi:hypothetical protein
MNETIKTEEKLDELKNIMEIITANLLVVQKEFESLELSERDKHLFELFINESLIEFLYLDENGEFKV